MTQKKYFSQLVLPLILILSVTILTLFQISFIKTQYTSEIKQLQEESSRKTTETALLLEDELLLLPSLIQAAVVRDAENLTVNASAVETAVQAVQFWNKHAQISSVFSGIYIYLNPDASESDTGDHTTGILRWDTDTFVSEQTKQTRNLTEILHPIVQNRKKNETIWYISSEQGNEMIVSAFNEKYPDFYLITLIDTAVLSEKLLPRLVAQCFPEQNRYDLRLIDEKTGELLYTNQTDYNEAAFSRPDFSYVLFGGSLQPRNFEVPITPVWQIPMEIVQLSDEKTILSLRSHMRNRSTGSNIFSIEETFHRGLLLEVVHTDGSVISAAKKTALTTILFTFGSLSVLAAGIWILHRNMTKAQKLASLQQEFIATVTHELKTPLTVISSAAQNMAAGIVSREQIPRYGEMLREESEKLKKDIDYFLLYAGMNTLHSLPRSKCNIQDCILEVINLIRQNDFVRDTEIQLDLPPVPVFVQCDRRAIRGLIRNLAENAVKHAAEGQFLRIEVTTEQKNIVIRFIDHGRGIPAKEQKRIFEPFQRGNQAIAAQTEGSGIGLNLCKRIAELHGGSLVLESTSPSGSVFTVRLPKDV